MGREEALEILTSWPLVAGLAALVVVYLLVLGFSALKHFGEADPYDDPYDDPDNVGHS